MSEQSAPAGRREQFEEEIAAVRIKSAKTEVERRLIRMGIGFMALGLLTNMFAARMSTNLSDTRDVLSTVVLALFGLTLALVGAAVFVCYSMGRVLRFWLLRVIYEMQDAAK